MFKRETAKLKPEEISPQNRRAACYLYYDLATIASQLFCLVDLLEGLSSIECEKKSLEQIMGGLALLLPGILEITWALDEISNDVAEAHGLSMTLKAPDWWKQVEDIKNGVRVEK